MALVDLLYRCPSCGSEAVRGAGRTVGCDSCRTTFRHVGGDARVEVRGPSAGDEVRIVAVAELVPQDGDPVVPGPETPGGSPSADRAHSREAVVRARFAETEAPIRYRGALLGFVEQRTRTRRGVLKLDPEALRFAEDAGRSHTWPLVEIRAIQTSSSALQVSPGTGGVVSFRFKTDSPRHWEDLLKLHLQEAWRAEGWGEIVEFQPRIRSH